MLDLAATEFLLPACWLAAVDRGWFTPLGADARAAVESHLPAGTTSPPLLLQRAYEENLARTVGVLVQGDTVAHALRDAGVEFVPLKGWHTILSTWWPDPAMRVVRDLDVLVHEEDAPRARRALVGAGFAPLDVPHDDYADHELPAMVSPRHPVAVEIHTALAVSRWRHVLPSLNVFDRARDGRMSTTHAVLHSIVHAQLHDEAHLLRHLPVRALHELAVLSRSPLGGSIDWDEVRVRMSTAGRRGRAALDVHLGLSRVLFGADVPRPRSSTRVQAHRALCELELSRPRVAQAYRAVVFLPRAWGEPRMRRLYGAGNVWSLRARHATRRFRRASRSPISSSAPRDAGS